MTSTHIRFDFEMHCLNIRTVPYWPFGHSRQQALLDYDSTHIRFDFEMHCLNIRTVPYWPFEHSRQQALGTKLMFGPMII